MKMISCLVVACLMTFLPVRAQDAAVEERVNKLNGYIQDLQEKTEAQRKRIEDLDKQIDTLREQLDKPNNAVTQEDLRKLAEQVQEIDKKRAADKELILKEIEALGKVSAGASVRPAKTRKIDDTPVTGATAPNPNDKGYEYQIQSGDTLSVICAAYREKNIKVTVDQILKANPGLKPTSLKVGQKIFIPAPVDPKLAD